MADKPGRDVAGEGVGGLKEIFYALTLQKPSAMLREEDKLTEALIQIIQSLPETKKEKIASEITKKAKPRANWARLFKSQKDKSVQPFFLNANDEKEWRW